MSARVQRSFRPLRLRSGLTLFVLAFSITASGAQARTHCSTPAIDSSTPAIGSSIVGPGAATTSAAGFPIWKTIQLGEYRDVGSVRSAFDSSPCSVGMGAWVDEAIGRPTFSFTRTNVELDLVLVSVAELGFPEDGASIDAIYGRARSLGLEFCPPDLGLALRLNY